MESPYMWSAGIFYLSKKNFDFAQNARLALILDAESEFAVKIDLATNLGVGSELQLHSKHFRGPLLNFSK